MADVPRTTEPTNLDPLPARGRVAFFVVRHEWDGVLRVVVRVPRDAAPNASGYPGVAQRTIDRYPGMVAHRCANGHRLGIVHELASTEIAHLFEHVLIEEAVTHGVPRSELSGETAWDFGRDGAGVYRVLVRGITSEELAQQAASAAACATGELLVLG